MQSHGGATAAKKAKSREVSPRYLSPASSTASSSSTADYYHGSHESPNSILSPIKQKPDLRKSKTLKNSGFLRGLWPSSSVPSSKPKKKPDTLADFIGDERREESERRKSKEKFDRNPPPPPLNRQRSCTEFSRFGNERENSKENRNPILGGSMRFNSEKFKFPGKSDDDNDENILPGRFSVDDVALRKNSVCDSGSECSDAGPNSDFSPASYMAPTVSSRKHRIDVPSRFMQDLSRSRRWSGGSDHSSENNTNNNSGSNNNSPKIFNLKKGSGDWAWSPARTGSPRPPLGENKGKMAAKPPTSPSKGKGVGNILSLGFEKLLKGRKSSSSLSSGLSVLGPGSAENVHGLRLLHNGLAQWRFSNARAEAANENYIKNVQGKSQHVQIALFKLQQSILQKKFQLQKEKLEMKLDYIFHSQIKALEAWVNMEKEHLSAVSNTTDSLHNVVCKLPLVDGAKVEPQLASVAMCHASNLATKINMMVTSFQPTVEKTVGVVAELAKVVIQEKQLLEECMDLFKFISALEIEERSLRGSMMQLRLMEQQLGMLA
ncbi:QWRF motif-containing protein 3 [Salvia miltiorrhiza]|uniref:QWRF motif-containing protein 3 n=1 Tax=Salvia miltiorrhiza TaxID=226208 RepID=UPI0025AD777F|nr:QWRF motif-containing protein 3 [Salvia miltiorrhiza]